MWRVNVTGQVIQLVYQCVEMCKRHMTYGYLKCSGCSLQGLLVLNNNLYVIYYNGTLIEININNTNTVQVYQVPDVRNMRHYGSLSYHPSVITHPDLLLLADFSKGEIFSYNVTSKNKQVHLRRLRYPTSVSFTTYNSHLYYVVRIWGNDHVRVYNSNWGLYQTLGGTSRGTDDGQLYFPYSAIGLPDGSVIITDFGNHRISLFTIWGRFVRHLLTESDRLSNPQDMSISLRYLWFIDYGDSAGIYRLYRYKLY